MLFRSSWAGTSRALIHGWRVVRVDGEVWTAEGCRGAHGLEEAAAYPRTDR